MKPTVGTGWKWFITFKDNG